MVRNITDVDDSILPKARELGVPYLELAAAEIARFHSDMDALEMRPPVAEPRATESIAADHRARRPAARLRATRTSAAAPVYFDVSTFPDFGKLSHYPEDRDGASSRATRGGNPDDPHRRAAARLRALAAVARRRARVARAVRRGPAGLAHRVLGDGRCTSTARPSTCTAAAPISSSRTTSARSRRARSLTGEPFVRHWMHSAMVNYEGEKMSKSLGNLVFVERPAEDRRPARDPARADAAPLPLAASSGTTPTSTRRVALLHRLLAAAERADRSRPGAVRAAGARRDRRRPRRAARARRARRPRERDPLRRRRSERAGRCCASSAALLGVDLDRPIAVGASA